MNLGDPLMKSGGVPTGVNIESVAIRKAEIEASIELLHEIKNFMEEN